MPLQVTPYLHKARSEAIPHRGIPIIIGMDRSGIANLAVAFLDQRIETEMQFRTMTHYASLQPKGTLRLHLKRPVKGYSLGSVSEHRDGFFVSSRLAKRPEVPVFLADFRGRQGAGLFLPRRTDDRTFVNPVADDANLIRGQGLSRRRRGHLVGADLLKQHAAL